MFQFKPSSNELLLACGRCLQNNRAPWAPYSEGVDVMREPLLKNEDCDGHVEEDAAAAPADTSADSFHCHLIPFNMPRL